MSETLNDTPNANRLHIGFFGKRNSGKSSLINAFTGQGVSIVSDVAGTTTDPVYKAMEVNPLGACVIIDTAGFDDVGDLGGSRVEKTRLAAQKTDIAVVVFADGEIKAESEWCSFFKSRKTPLLCVVNIFSERNTDYTELVGKVKELIGEEPLVLNAKSGDGVGKLRTALARLIPEDYGNEDLTGGLAKEGDTVLLVMPQDIQAPKGRLILPQVQVIRALLDKKCTAVCVTADKLEESLSRLSEPPQLMITDSQVFRYCFDRKPETTKLTSFSVLFAAYKGDIAYYLEGAAAIESLSGKSKVLIAECCTHAPLSEDIGRVKIPRMLKNRFGSDMTVDIVSGTDYPEKLDDYDLIIQCGACMFNRKYVLARIDRAREQRVPMTNYGVAIAYLSGILSDIVTP